MGVQILRSYLWEVSDWPPESVVAEGFLHGTIGTSDRQTATAW